jgi:hypothetical protein
MFPCGMNGNFGTFACAFPAEDAQPFIDDGSPSHHGCMNAAFNSPDLFDLRARMDRYQGMVPQPFDIRPEGTEGAVIRRVEFVQFRNLTSQGVAFFHQVNGPARIGNIKGGADSRNPAANDQHG